MTEKKYRSRTILVSMSLAIVFAVIFVSYLARPVSVSGDSMSPTLRSGQIVLACMLPRTLCQPAAGQIIVARLPNQKVAIKRIAERSGGRVTLHGDNRDLSRDYQQIAETAVIGTVWWSLAPLGPIGDSDD